MVEQSELNIHTYKALEQAVKAGRGWDLRTIAMILKLVDNVPLKQLHPIY